MIYYYLLYIFYYISDMIGYIIIFLHIIIYNNNNNNNNIGYYKINILLFGFLLSLQGRVTFVFSIEGWDMGEFPFHVIMRSYLYLLERLMINEETQITGCVLIENFNNYSIKQALGLRPSELRMFVDILQVSFLLFGIFFLSNTHLLYTDLHEFLPSSLFNGEVPVM